MTNRESSQGVVQQAATQVRADAVDAFELLGNDTRLAILLALWEAYDPHAFDRSVSFSELREVVGMRDSGQFNYHLTQLLGEFVEKTDEGYALLPLGLKVVQTVVGGAGTNTTLPKTELDVPCRLCGATTAIMYQHGWLYHVCTSCEGAFGAKDGFPSGVLFGEPVPPAALENRTPEEVFAAGVFRLQSIFTMKMGGICPQCSGVFETTIDICEVHRAVEGTVCEECGNLAEMRVKWVCSVCKYRGSTTPATALGFHPAVLAFYYERGVDVGYTANEFESASRLLELLSSHEQELLSTDPLRIRVTVAYEGDELQLTADEHLDVVEITEDTA